MFRPPGDTPPAQQFAVSPGCGCGDGRNSISILTCTDGPVSDHAKFLRGEPGERTSTPRRRTYLSRPRGQLTYARYEDTREPTGGGKTGGRTKVVVDGGGLGPRGGRALPRRSDGGRWYTTFTSLAGSPAIGRPTRARGSCGTTSRRRSSSRPATSSARG
eukprot:1723671-Prymnesium_polylepis.2